MKKILSVSALILGLFLTILPHFSLAANVNVILDTNNGAIFSNSGTVTSPPRWVSTYPKVSVIGGTTNDHPVIGIASFSLTLPPEITGKEPVLACAFKY